MALVTRSTTASMDLSSPYQTVAGVVAGEALDRAAACYIDSDGLVYMSNATALDKERMISGFTPRAYAVGEVVTLFGPGTRFKYGTGLTPGATFYLGATNGRLDTAATTGDAVGCALVVSATDIVITRINPELAASTAINGANLANTAQANAVGGVPVVHSIAIAAGAIGDTDLVLTHKTRIIDAWLILKGAGVALTTLQLKKGAAAITDAMAASGADQALVRAATIDDANWEIAAGGTLRVTSATGATQPDAIVYALGVRIA